MTNGKKMEMHTACGSGEEGTREHIEDSMHEEGSASDQRGNVVDIFERKVSENSM
jgi:hypothetical protein